MNKRVTVDASPASLVSRFAVAGLFLQMLLSWPLWQAAERGFPLLPLFGTMAWEPPPLLAGILLSIALALLAAVFLLPGSRKWTAALCAGLILLVAADANRLQPWLYYYLLLWTAIAAEPHAPVRPIRWIIAAVYVFGGLFKLTPWFANDNFAWFCEAFSWSAPLGQHAALGYATAAAEALLGAGLLVRRTRPAFRRLALAFHGFIALALSPAGLDWNTVVIPWNLAMAAQVWVAFRDDEPARLPAAPAGKMILVWVFAAPLLHIAGFLPETMAWKLYTNTQAEITFAVNNATVCPELRPVWRRHAYDRKSKLLIDDWAMAELHTPAAKGRRAAKQLGRFLCRCAEDPGNSALLILEANPRRYGETRVDTLPCKTLLPEN